MFFFLLAPSSARTPLRTRTKRRPAICGADCGHLIGVSASSPVVPCWCNAIGDRPPVPN